MAKGALGGAGAGGAIYSKGTLNLSGDTLQSNTAQGVYIESIEATNGQGGGLYVAGGTVSLSNDTFSNNKAVGHSFNYGAGGGGLGGGMYIWGGNVSLIGDTFSANQAQGGPGAKGTLGSNLGDPASGGGTGGTGGGGGVFIAGGSLTLTNDSFSGNKAVGGTGGTGGNGSTRYHNGYGGQGGTGGLGIGGGLWVMGGSATLINDTISGNKAMAGAGGAGGPSPVNGKAGKAGKSGDGIGGGLDNSGTTSLVNTLIAGNSSAAGSGGQAYGSDVGGYINSSGVYVNGTVNSLGHNLIGTTAGSTGWVSSDLVGYSAAELYLGPLANNGGPTQTMALQTNSPAINAGDSAVSGLPSTDQRGYRRIIGGAVDIGAVEYQYDLGLTGHLAAGKSLGTVQYVYTLTNNGPDSVSDVTLTVTLPAGIDFSSLSAPSSQWSTSNPLAGNSGTVTFEYTGGNLSSGQSASFTITASVADTTVGKSFTTIASVGPTAADDNLSNNSVNLTVTNEQEGQSFHTNLYNFTGGAANSTAGSYTGSVYWGQNDSNSITGFGVNGASWQTNNVSQNNSIQNFGGNGTGWQENQDTAPGGSFSSTEISNNLLTLTDGGSDEYRSAFYNTPLYLTGDFSASFTYTATSTIATIGGASSFVLAASPSLLGYIGGGYGGSASFGPSLAVEIAASYPGSGPGVALATNGSYTPDFRTLSSVDLTNSDPKSITISYDAAAQSLTVEVEDQNVHTSDTVVFNNVNLGSIFNGSDAYVGFTGGDGAAVSTQQISNFNFANNNTSGSGFENFNSSALAASSTGNNSVQIVPSTSSSFSVDGTYTYDEAGDYATDLLVTGQDGTTAVRNAQQLFNVVDAPLTAVSLTPPPNAAINLAITNAALFHFTDADPNGTASDYTANIKWGDGTITTVTSTASSAGQIVADPTGGFDVLGSHTYTQILNPGTFSVQVSDADGASVSDSDNTFQVLYPDKPLTSGKLNIPSVNTEGKSISEQPPSDQPLFQFTDADTEALASQFLASVSWGDGTFNSSNDGSSTVSVQKISSNSNGIVFGVYGAHTYVAGSWYFAVHVADEGDPNVDTGGSVAAATSADPLKIAEPAVIASPGPAFTAIPGSLSAVQTVATFTDPGGAQFTYVPDLNSPTVSSSGGSLAAGTYFYTVTGTTAQGESTPSNEVFATTTGSTSEVTLTWFAAPGATGYKIYRGTTPSGESTLIATINSATTLSFIDDGRETTSSASPSTINTASVYPETNPNPHVAFVQWGDGTISEATLNAQYNYSAPILSSSHVPVASASAVSSSSSSLAPGTYYYTVTSTTANGESTPSNEVSATTTSSANAVSLSWSPVAGATGYNVYRGTSPGAESTLIAIINNGTTLSFTDDGKELATFTAQPQQVIGRTLLSSSATPGIVLGSDGKTFSINLAHQYAADGIYPVSTIINHDGQFSKVVKTTAVVGSITTTAAAPITSTYGTTLTNVTLATFTDTFDDNSASDYSAKINWGDGQTSSGTIGGSNGNFTVRGGHNYAAVGTYPISITVSLNLDSTVTSSASTKATINRLAVTLTGRRFYDGTNIAAFSILTVSNEVSGDDLTLSGSATLASANAGTEAITSFAGLTLVGSSAGNYTLTGASGSVTIRQAITSFSNLTVPQMTVGTATTTVSGQLTSNTIIPAGASVTITLDDVTQWATVRTNGSFSSIFTTSALGVGTYTINYSYAGDNDFTAATGSGSLTVAYGKKLLFNNTKPVHSGACLPIKLELTDASGTDVSSPSIAVTAFSLTDFNGNTVQLNSEGHANPNKLFRYDPRLGGYIFNLDTKGLAAGTTYTFTYKAGDDPTLHSLTFVVD